ncbi:MAG: hypothetical protein PVH04_08715 [Gammaproteobacteria bacterium]|jgi:hypothetical protein
MPGIENLNKLYFTNSEAHPRKSINRHSGANRMIVAEPRGEQTAVIRISR